VYFMGFGCGKARGPAMTGPPGMRVFRLDVSLPALLFGITSETTVEPRRL
jgi:hypothetical protein